MAEQGFSSANLDEIESLPAPWAPGIAWRPIRFHFGLQAFGINAYTASEAGAELIEEHDETGGSAGGHEELYLVLAGRARFTVGGREIEAAAGTFVSVRDRGLQRKAVALDPGTTVVVIGGPVGEPFEVSPWEYAFRAHGASRRGAPGEAVAIILDGLRQHPDHPHLLYQLACFEALAGDEDAALAHLRRSVELDPKFARYAGGDADLDSIRDRAGFPAAPAEDA
jgi:hypothetical protein